ncbi:MAG TPA: hypothetical protein VGB83_06575 [Actinomycetota bacterium]
MADRSGARPGGIVLVEAIRFVIVVACTALGYQVARALVSDISSGSIVVGALLGSSVGYVLGGLLGRRVGALAGAAEMRLVAMSGADLVAGGGGLIGGIVVGTALGLPLLLLPSRAVGLPMLAFVQIVFGFLGYRVAIAKREDLLQLFGLTYRTRAPDLRVLDSSAIMAPTLLDFVRAGVIRGTLLVPTFVLEETQGLADGQDSLRRRRATSGLEALSVIKSEGLVQVRAVDRSYPQFDDVDAKLVALAAERGATLVTDDAPLARVAELQGVEVLHLRRMAAAVRPQVAPGDRAMLRIERAGKEPGQGVGFLDDGSMVVVPDAAHLVGREVEVELARTVRTSGGTLLFANRVEEERGRAGTS